MVIYFLRIANINNFIRFVKRFCREKHKIRRKLSDSGIFQICKLIKINMLFGLFWLLMLYSPVKKITETVATDRLFVYFTAGS